MLQAEFDLKAKRNAKRTNPSSNAYIRKALTVEMLLFATVKSIKRSLVAHATALKAPPTLRDDADGRDSDDDFDDEQSVGRATPRSASTGFGVPRGPGSSRGPVPSSMSSPIAATLGYDAVLLSHEVLNPDSGRVWWKQLLDMNEVVDALITLGIVGVRALITSSGHPPVASQAATACIAFHHSSFLQC